jgi:glycosyltransferase involved in cell wall biosynthesis
LFGELSRRRDEADLADHLMLTGFVPDALLPAAYRAADLSVVPSVALEGFGLVVAESLASGTPALVTAVGGLPETVEGLSADCVLENLDSRALGVWIGEALLGRLSLPAREVCVQHAREHFDWSVAARHISNVYQKAIA